METNEIAAVGYAIAMTAMALLTVLLLSRWQNSHESKFLAMATGSTVVWAAALALQCLGYVAWPVVTMLVEWLRCVTWLIALIAILRQIDRARLAERMLSRYGFFVLLPLVVAPFVYHVVTSTDPTSLVATVGIGFLAAALILSTTEQIYRNAPIDARTGLNYFCIAIVGTFVYDVVLHVSTIAGKPMGPEYWAARGYVNAMFALPLSVGIWRAFRMPIDVQIPRQIIFYTFGLIALGTYLVLIVVGHYYISVYGGSWSAVASIVFIVGAVASVAVLMTSAVIRARIRVFLMKTFLQYKYDYRKEWLRFIATLSESGLENVSTSAVRAIAQIVNSPGGIVWVQAQEGEAYLPIGSWRCEIPTLMPIDSDASLVRFLVDRQWVIDLQEMERHPARYEGLQVSPWFLERDDWWLIVPLSLKSRLFGFIVLKKPRVVPSLNFEDHDLLRTAGRHVGMHINQAETDRRLAESSQFGTYNRLSAFLMHDLNNVIAQQSLVVKNAERFRDNPKFVDDAIDTIANSVLRMKRLMEQLSGSSKSTPRKRRVDLREALTRVVKRCELRQPVPELIVDSGPINVQADPERLTAIIEHLVRNAQDATTKDGRIIVKAGLNNGEVHLSISDTGEGMSSEFIRERLFRPFDSTKGSQSMGIGAYQARDYVRALGGQIEVSSTVGAGTTFSIRLPESR